MTCVPLYMPRSGVYNSRVTHPLSILTQLELWNWSTAKLRQEIDIYRFVQSVHTVDSRHMRESIERAEFVLHVELWFGEQANGAVPLSLSSTRHLQLNFHPVRGLHYHLPVVFDYFHLSAINLGIHASLIAIHQPYIK